MLALVTAVVDGPLSKGKKRKHHLGLSNIKTREVLIFRLVISSKLFSYSFSDNFLLKHKYGSLITGIIYLSC
jgi:hypothetical protein